MSFCVQSIGTKKLSVWDFFRKNTKPEIHQTQYIETGDTNTWIFPNHKLSRSWIIDLYIHLHCPNITCRELSEWKSIRTLFLSLCQNFSTSVDKTKLQYRHLFTSPNKSKQHSFVFEILPLSSVKSQTRTHGFLPLPGGRESFHWCTNGWAHSPTNCRGSQGRENTGEGEKHFALLYQFSAWLRLL